MLLYVTACLLVCFVARAGVLARHVYCPLALRYYNLRSIAAGDGANAFDDVQRDNGDEDVLGDIQAELEGELKEALLAGPVRVALRAARPILEPELEDRYGLVWQDLQPLFPILTDEGQVELLVTDPLAFMQELWESGKAVEAVKVLAIFFMRPKIEPRLPPALDFETVVAVLRLVDTYDELQAAAMDPPEFMLRLGDATLVPIIRNMLVSLLLEAGVDKMILAGIGKADDKDNPEGVQSIKAVGMKLLQGELDVALVGDIFGVLGLSESMLVRAVRSMTLEHLRRRGASDELVAPLEEYDDSKAAKDLPIARDIATRLLVIQMMQEKTHLLSSLPSLPSLPTETKVEKITELVTKLSPQERTFFTAKFERYDVDNSGFIELNEFRKVMEELTDEQLSDDELQQEYRDLDTNGDGKLDLGEFIALMVKFMEKVSQQPARIQTEPNQSGRQRRVAQGDGSLGQGRSGAGSLLCAPLISRALRSRDACCCSRCRARSRQSTQSRHSTSSRPRSSRKGSASWRRA